MVVNLFLTHLVATIIPYLWKAFLWQCRIRFIRRYVVAVLLIYRLMCTGHVPDVDGIRSHRGHLASLESFFHRAVKATDEMFLGGSSPTATVSLFGPALWVCEPVTLVPSLTILSASERDYRQDRSGYRAFESKAQIGYFKVVCEYGASFDCRLRAFVRTLCWVGCLADCECRERRSCYQPMFRQEMHSMGCQQTQCGS